MIKNNFKVILIIIVLIIIVISIISNNGMSNEEKEELRMLYDTEDIKDEFLKDFDILQSEVAKHLINNMTFEENSFENTVKYVNNKLKNNDFKFLEVDIVNNYEGKYSIDEEGNLKFKFLNKDIEPNWVSEYDFIILN